MPFRFQLETVLRLRRSVERQQELLLKAAHHDVLEMQQQIQDLDAWQLALGRNQIESLNSGTAAAELLFGNVLRSAAAGRKPALQKQLLSLRKTRDQKIAAFDEARRKREIIENLKNQRISAYRMNQARKDQRTIDDLYLLSRTGLWAGRNRPRKP